MNRKWLFAAALGAVIVTGVSSPALADDYCASPYAGLNVYVGGGYSHGNGGYGYVRQYDSYNGGYGYQGNYGYQGDYGYEGNYGYQGNYGHGGYPQTRYQYSQPYYQDGYGRQGYGATVHEDHIRTTFKPFPFPRIEKRVVHHEHPIY